MPTFLLSLITSGSIKWLSILVIIAGLAGGLYMKHREIVNNEKQIALQQYNIKQLEQIVKDRNAYIEEIENVNRARSEAINGLTQKNRQLEKKLESVVSQIDKHVGAGRDRESSQILKDTIRSLEGMK